MSTENRPKVKYNRFDFYVENDFRLLRLDNRKEIDGAPNPAYGKRPVVPNWNKRKGMNASSAYETMKKGHNIGAAIPAGVVIIDVDTRKNGLENLAVSLCEYIEDQALDVPDTEDYSYLVSHLCDLTYSVRTSNGGHHFYFRCPEGFLPSNNLSRPEGVDVLYEGRQAVTPGSVHPQTSEYYQAVGQDEIADLPKGLEKYFLKGFDNPFESLDYEVGADSLAPHALWGLIQDYELEKLLAVLPPEKCSNYDEHWFPLLCASHHATAGQGLEAFTRWSEADPSYADEAQKAIEKKWKGLKDKRKGEKSRVATIGTILSAAEKQIKELIMSGKAPSTLLQSKSGVKRQLYENTTLTYTDEVTLEEVIDLCRELRQKTVESELLFIDDDQQYSKLLSWIGTLQPGWEISKPSLFDEIVIVAAKMNERKWPFIAAALSKVSTSDVSATKIEKYIKAHSKKVKQATKAGPLDLTYAESIEAVANAAVEELASTPEDNPQDFVTCPPNKQIYRYTSGVWRIEPMHCVDSVCYRKAKEIVDTTKRSARPLTDIAAKSLSTITKLTSTPKTDLYARKELPSCINLKNGTLWFDDNGTTTFKPHDRDDYLTTQLPYDYTPEAICPAFDTMLEQVFDHVRAEYSTKERDELTRHFWELIGYIIQPRKDLPKIMIWTGEGQNGKSRIAQIISRLVGQNAWLSVDLRSFFSKNQPHNSSSLEGKLILVDDDVKSGAVLDDGDLKKVCQSKVLQVNPKNRDPYDVLLQLVPLIITNNRVRLDDTSEGSYRRLDVIEWNTNISHLQDSPLPDLVEAEQMPGVLNKAAQGLSRLRARGQFELPRCVQDYRARFISSSNTALSFWESVDRVGVPGIKHPASRLYTQYIQFMADEGNGRPMRRDEFNDAIRRSGVRINRDYVHDWIVSDFI